MPLRPAPAVQPPLPAAAECVSPLNAWTLPASPRTPPMLAASPRTPQGPTLLQASSRRVASSQSQIPSKGANPFAMSNEPLVQEEVLTHIATLKNSCSVAERYHAAERLADLGPKALAARAALEDRLRRDTNGIVRKSSALALGLIGSKDAEICLAHAARNDKCQFVRKRASEALIELAGDGLRRL